MAQPPPNVAVIGATGAVGRELIGCLERRGFPLSRLQLFATARSAGRQLLFRGQSLPVEVMTEKALYGIDIALFSAGGATSSRYIPSATRSGTLAIDNSSAFRMDAEVPLVVPEVNAEAIATHRGIIANPNCVAIIAAVPLWPLHRAFGLRRLIASTYQAASGAGAAAMEELREATRAALVDRDYEPRVLRHRYAFNLYSHDTQIDSATGSNEEELKVMRELRKIMSLADLRVSVTCIRVPVLRAHAISLTAEFEQPVSALAARQVLSAAPGVRLVDDQVNNHFPMPIEASGQGDVLVGRIREDPSDPSAHSHNLFIAGDQLLKGAALNAVQIAESLLADVYS
jgi:aspartate-semialdehyde dehydrogenase